MKTIIIAILLAIPLTVSARGLDVISANGFECSKDGELVHCQGKFEKGQGTIGAVGESMVVVSFNDGVFDYVYSSQNGCKWKTTPKKGTVINRWGKSKTFRDMATAERHCAQGN